MKQSVLSLKEKQPDIDFLLSYCPHALKTFYDSPVKYYFGRF